MGAQTETPILLLKAFSGAMQSSGLFHQDSQGYWNGVMGTTMEILRLGKQYRQSNLMPTNWSCRGVSSERTLRVSLHRQKQPTSQKAFAALSPEDLTDTEWYYLVCMSFVFNVGQGLPGRTLANGQPIWLCNAHYADSKVFSRSLLAKTVVCFPFLGGVIELGVTELVLEDPSFIQHIKTSFLEIPYPIVYNTSRSGSGNARSDKDLIHTKLDQEILDTNFNAIVGFEEARICSSPNNSSNMFGLNQQQRNHLWLKA